MENKKTRRQGVSHGAKNLLEYFVVWSYWLISNNLNDLVQLTDIIPAIKNHDAIFLENSDKLQNDIKGLWKKNCSMLIYR